MSKEPNVICENCGKSFYKYPSEIKRCKRHFCSRQCNLNFYNKNLNPKNKSEGWSLEQRIKASDRERKAKKCKSSTYPKYLGRHLHRANAEIMLGRKLMPGEVVHHKNGNKHDNRIENLMVFKNQQEHVKYHAEHPDESGVLLGKR